MSPNHVEYGYSTLKLKHDEKPIDSAQLKSPFVKQNLERNFGFKGFPRSYFETGRQPLPKNSHLPQYKSNIYEEEISDNNSDQRMTDEHISYSVDPIMSAKLRKFKEMQAQTQEYINYYKQEKQLQLTAREDEKKRDLQLLQSYDPWGRPGGGAPNTDGYHKKPLELDKTSASVDGQHNNMSFEKQTDFNGYFGRPGAGAPLRTESGHVKASIKTDTDIRFQPNDKAHKGLKQIRYKQPTDVKVEYGQFLEHQLQERSLKEQEERLAELRKEIDQLKYDPYGKPGAGAPNSTQKPEPSMKPGQLVPSLALDDNNHSHSQGQGQRSPQTGSQDQSTTDNKHVLKSLLNPNEQQFDPWGKGYGSPRRDSHGNTVRLKHGDQVAGETTTYGATNGVSLDMDRFGHAGGGGAPVRDNHGNTVSRREIRFRSNRRGDPIISEPEPLSKFSVDPAHHIHFPYGRPGAGAPITDQNGYVRTGLQRNTIYPHTSQTITQSAKLRYLNDLKLDAEEQSVNKMLRDYDLKHGGGELAAVIGEGKVGHPRRDPNTGFLAANHRATTDVTRLQANERRLKDEQSALYHTELEQEAEHRRHMMQLEKQQDLQREMQHIETSDTFFGRPGGGAPQVTGPRLPRLEDVLHSPRRQPDGFYCKQIVNGHLPTAYVRSTINSNHRNNFQMNTTPSKHSSLAAYHVSMPYATHNKPIGLLNNTR